MREYTRPSICLSSAGANGRHVAKMKISESSGEGAFIPGRRLFTDRADISRYLVVDIATIVERKLSRVREKKFSPDCIELAHPEIVNSIPATD